MAEVRPFRGIRYARSLSLDDLVSPPYDVLTASQAAELRARSPFNAVHLDLPVGPGEPSAHDAYIRAAEAFHAWQREGVLNQDDDEALYVVEQAYRGPDGRERIRRGFVARIVLADLGEGVVRPHEKTHAGPKTDRLALYRATHADLSQIFLLYPDERGEIAGELSTASAMLSPSDFRQAHDADGNEHRVAALASDRAARICGLLRDQVLYIADGHHRYETALAYRDERRAVGDHSADTMMVYLCGMSDPGLTIFPTHRLIRRDAGTRPMAEVLRRLEEAFDVVQGDVGDDQGAQFIREGLASANDPGHVFGLAFPQERGCAIVRLRDSSALDRLVMEGFSGAAAGLTVTILHYLILRDAAGVDPYQTEGKIDYVSHAEAAFARLGTGEYALGAFINPTRVDEVKTIADQGETMPQKSTYFYPKLLTGLVFDALGD